MNKQLKTILITSMVSILLVLGIGAAVKQVIGPSAPTVAGQVAIWTDTSAWKLTNCPVIINGLGDMSGIGTVTATEIDSTTTYTTNGTQYLQHTLDDDTTLKALIGGSASVTNYLIRNVNGALMKYWCNGTTVWSQEIGTHN